MDFLEKNKLLMTLLFIIPGFIAMKTYSVVSSGERVDGSKSIIDAIAYSCLNYAIFALPIYLVFTTHFTRDRPIVSGSLWVLILLVAPVGEAVGLFYLRKHPLFSRWAPHPTSKPWDYVFSKPGHQFVILQLKSGKRFGGLYDYKSFASSYPSPEQLYIEKVYDVDKKNNFVREHPCSKGMLIEASELEFIEFIGEEDVEQEPDQNHCSGWLATCKKWLYARFARASAKSADKPDPSQTAAAQRGE